MAAFADAKADATIDGLLFDMLAIYYQSICAGTRDAICYLLLMPERRH